MIRVLLGLILCAALSGQVRPESANGICYWISDGNGFQQAYCSLEQLTPTSYKVLFQPQQRLLFLHQETPELVPVRVGTITTGTLNHPDLGGAWWVGDEDWGSLTIVPIDPAVKQFLAGQGFQVSAMQATYSIQPHRDSQGQIVKGVFLFEVSELATTQALAAALESYRFVLRLGPRDQPLKVPGTVTAASCQQTK